MNNTDIATDGAAQELARAIFLVSLPVQMIYAETARYGEDSLEAPHETTVRLLAESFGYLVKRHGAGQMRQAAELLQHAFDVICSEIYVPADIGQDDVSAP